MLWGSFDVQDSSTSSHPLCIAVCNRATATVVIPVIENPINYVCHRFKTTVWVPRSSLWFTWCIFNFAHLIQVNEWIKLRHIHARKSASDWKAFTFETLRSSRNRSNSTGNGVGRNIHARQHGDVFDGYCRHRSLLRLRS
ncbi:unannotated protein [freshwater metagenome]|uniref:Unannotated protein n=1 Tax=freshwater metagenome TaxID=449393 RepID=A0A6J6Q4P6_9ZZZZ